jgi:hypothetical protein
MNGGLGDGVLPFCCPNIVRVATTSSWKSVPSGFGFSWRKSVLETPITIWVHFHELSVGHPPSAFFTDVA